MQQQLLHNQQLLFAVDALTNWPPNHTAIRIPAHTVFGQLLSHFGITHTPPPDPIEVTQHQIRAFIRQLQQTPATALAAAFTH